MKIISSYGVELRKQNIPIRQTLEIYRSAVRYLVRVSLKDLAKPSKINGLQTASKGLLSSYDMELK